MCKKIKYPTRKLVIITNTHFFDKKTKVLYFFKDYLLQVLRKMIFGIHFHTLRHTYSNMLFEADQNPKVIQNLLGHKSVKTTITTCNSVDKSYFQKATDVLNNNFKTSESKQTQELEDDELDEELERLLKEKQERRRRKQHYFEM